MGFSKKWAFVIAIAALLALSACSSDAESSASAEKEPTPAPAEQPRASEADGSPSTDQGGGDDSSNSEPGLEDVVPANPALALLDAPISSEMPYETRFIDINGVNIAYVEAGEGDPILFVHGNPSSKFLWRNIMPHLQTHGRVIALDLPGFGESELPPGDRGPSELLGYLEGFIEEMRLSDITLVLHDWGSHLGFSYASQNEENIKAIAFMESQIGPGFPLDIEALPERQRMLIDQIKGPNAEPFIVDQNAFVDQNFSNAILRPVPEATDAVLRERFEDRDARYSVMALAGAIPLVGDTDLVAQRVIDYTAWFMASDVPKLHLYVTPGGINPPQVAQFFLSQGVPNYQSVFVGYGVHFIQEDEPEAIGRNISDWYLRIDR